MRKLTLVIATWILSSCNDGTTDPSGASAIQGSWELQSIQIGDTVIAVAGEPESYTAEFGADGRLAVRADCNRCASAYSTSGTALDIGVLACTRAYCGPESLEGDYVSALDLATSFERSASSLVVRHPGGALRFTRLR